MNPEFNLSNLRKALKHPSLLVNSLRSCDEVELAQKHVNIHLNNLSKIKIPKNITPSLETICQAIDLFSESCYHTEYLYLVCKLFKPNIFVETGVHYGASSAFILKALQENGADGKLYSIDLPNVEYAKDLGGVHNDFLPKKDLTGFVVPDSLRGNWKLILNDSKVELPKLLDSIGELDVFHHDSMHTYDLMMFEFQTAYPKLKEGGLLLSDDADWTNSFKDFCEEKKLEYKIHDHIGVAIKK